MAQKAEPHSLCDVLTTPLRATLTSGMLVTTCMQRMVVLWSRRGVQSTWNHYCNLKIKSKELSSKPQTLVT